MKKVYFLIGILMLIITIYEINKVYAKYVTNAIAIGEQAAGAWTIKVNNSDITDSTGIEKEFTINSLTYLENENVADGKMAPSSIGYFDITVDPTGSTVAVRYDVTLDMGELASMQAITFDSAYKVENGVETENTLIKTDSSTYSNIITLDEVKANETSTARFYLKWEEDETGENDQTDTEIGTTKDLQVGIPIKIIVTQYLGEELEVYQ